VGPSIRRLLLLPKQLHKLETFISSYKFVFATAALSYKALRKGFLNDTCIAKILVLSKNQQEMNDIQLFNGIESKQYYYFPFFLKKELLTECQWKVIALSVSPT